MPKAKYAAYKPAHPYFALIRRALGDLVDGEHFFDTVTADTIYEVLYDLGWPRVIRGRTDLMAAFRGYVDSIALQSANKLVVHKTDKGRAVVLEYEVHGTILATGVKYNNRFCSIVEIKNRKIAHCRDYMDDILAAEGIVAEIDKVLVTDEQMANERKFPGSPTIRIDGRDVTGASQERQGFALSCRLHQESKQIGLPPGDFIRWAVLEATKGGTL